MNAVQIIKMATNGNLDAEAFCTAWLDFSHTLDDCADRDKPTGPDILARVMVQFVLQLSGNPFFLANKGILLGLMVQAANYWVESNERQSFERDILKAQWHSVVYQSAFLVGGWSHMRRVTGETMSFNYEDVK